MIRYPEMLHSFYVDGPNDPRDTTNRRKEIDAIISGCARSSDVQHFAEFGQGLVITGSNNERVGIHFTIFEFPDGWYRRLEHRRHDLGRYSETYDVAYERVFDGSVEVPKHACYRIYSWTWIRQKM